MITPAFSDGRRDAFAERLINSALGMMDVLGVYVGVRLGLYDALKQGPATSSELAARTKTHERYVREWLEHQAAGGVLDVDDAAKPAAERRYALSPEHAEVLLDEDSQNWVAPITRLIVGAASPLQRLLDAYRTGDGIPYADYGIDLLEGQAAINRPAFLDSLPNEWLPAMPDVDARLKASPPAKIADLGCGAGWSCIGIAKEYPGVQVDGFDLDPASVEMAQANVKRFGVEDRVSIQLRNAGDPALAGQYDLVMVLEALHDMSDPVAALRVMRKLMAPGGAALVVDERVGERFTAPADDIERLMYGWSFLHCLPAGMAEQPSVATGTVMRPSTVEAYAKDAGFSSVEVLPVEHLFFRLYRLLP